jgi:hypothetical protein
MRSDRTHRHASDGVRGHDDAKVVRFFVTLDFV